MDALQLLTAIIALLLSGLIVSVLSAKLRIPDLALLILTGTLFGYKIIPIDTELPALFLNTVTLLALIVIIFEGSVAIKFRELNTFSLRALKLMILSTVTLMILMPPVTKLITGSSWVAALVFAGIICGTSPDVILSLLKNSKNQVVEVLKLESVFNTPLTVILPVFILGVAGGESLSTEFSKHILTFLTGVVTGIGAGVLIAMLLIKLIRTTNLQQQTWALGIMISAWLAYVLAENLGGNGVIAVTTLGLFFGNIYLGKIMAKHSVKITKFGEIFTYGLYVLVFVVLGITLRFPTTFKQFIVSIALFMFYLFLRFISVYWAFRKDFSAKELLFATVTSAKGIATATIILALSLGGIPEAAGIELQNILTLAMMVLFYSIVASTIMAKLSFIFVQQEIHEK